MFSGERFTRKANSVINKAYSHAGRLGHTYLGTEHLLLAMVTETGSTASSILRSSGVTEDKVSGWIVRFIGRGEPCTVSRSSVSPTVERIIGAACSDASATPEKPAGTEHILAALLREDKCNAVRILKETGTDPSTIPCFCLENSAARGFAKITKAPNLMKYGRDLTIRAAEGGCDPVLCRDKEIRQVIRILSRKTKNNPCLVGEAGVGKTAVAEGVAAAVAEGRVPDELKGVHIFSLSLSSMLAGAKYRGDFEDRIKQCMDEVAENGKIILFIDELHTIVGAGAAEGAIDAANILKPQLARGEIRIIGATTYDEFRRFIGKDSALERRFQQVKIAEPSPEQAMDILRGLLPAYESFHKVRITDEALKAAVDMSVRYMGERYLPDKAIDLLDEAASKAHIERKAAVSENEKRHLFSDDCSEQDFSPFGAVTADDIAQVLSASTGIPTERICADEIKKLQGLEDELHKRIIGQDEAVSAAASAVRRGRAGFRDHKRPICSLLFAGPTGVGKTELSKALAEAVFDSGKAFIKMDMSECMEKHAVSRLIGAPPGYVGYDEGGQLTEQVRRKPYSVVLFDEIEKAHPDVSNILLQILEDGCLTDSQGRRVSFANCIIILTTNMGAAEDGSVTSVGFSGADEAPDVRNRRLRSEVMRKLKKGFRPELLGRIDEMIVFTQPDHEQRRKIAVMMLEELRLRAAEMEISLEFTDDAVETIISRSGTDGGAREIRRKVTELAENPLSEKFIAGEICHGDTVLISGGDGLVIGKTADQKH